jgi:hypothetical protein
MIPLFIANMKSLQLSYFTTQSEVAIPINNKRGCVGDRPSLDLDLRSV